MRDPGLDHEPVAGVDSNRGHALQPIDSVESIGQRLSVRQIPVGVAGKHGYRAIDPSCDEHEFTVGAEAVKSIAGRVQAPQ